MKKGGWFIFALTMVLAFSCIARSEGARMHAISSPGKKVTPGSFSLSQSGMLLVDLNGQLKAYTDGKWINSDELAKDNPYTILRQGLTTIVSLNDGSVIFFDNRIDAICPVSDQLAYATYRDILYRIDMTTHKRTAISYIDHYTSADYADCLLVSNDTVYILQTQRQLFQSVSIDTLENLKLETVNIAVATGKFDIGNVVLASTESAFVEKNPMVIVSTSYLSNDQLRLELMHSPNSFDLIVCAPELWNDLAQAGLFLDLTTNAELLSIWNDEWYNMDGLCMYEGVLMGVPIWDECYMLLASDRLTSRLNITWPESDWTWDDFLLLARECRMDLNQDGKPDTYLTYQKMSHLDIIRDEIQTYSLPVHQVAALYQSGALDSCNDEKVLHVLDVWKTCYDEGLLYPASADYDKPLYDIVVFPSTICAEWCEEGQTPWIRIAYPGFDSKMSCTPAQSVLISINQHSERMELASKYLYHFMKYGADEHNYLKEHHYYTDFFLKEQSGWKYPSDFRKAHYAASLEGAYRDTWDNDLYIYMEMQLDRFLEGNITAEQCAMLWQEKMNMLDME